MAKTSIKHNSIAWLSQYGTGDIVFVPLAQSSSFEVNYERVTHKGIGSKNLVGYYRYKDDNVSFNMSVLASQERTFGGLTRENFATETYVSGDIVDYDLSGCKSALYDTLYSSDTSGLSFYSLYDDVGSNDIALTTGYSGFYAKFEDCLLKNISISAEVGQVVSVDTEFMANDVSFLRSGIEYISGINEYHEAVRPQDVIIYLGSGTDTAYEITKFNVESINIDLPIDYKVVESFGASKPSHRKLVLPSMGTVELRGLPVEFQELPTSALEAEDVFFNMTVLFRSKAIGGGTGESDYMAIKFPKLYLRTQSLEAAVTERLNGSVSFVFFEGAEEYASGQEGMFFLRKMPDSVSCYAA